MQNGSNGSAGLRRIAPCTPTLATAGDCLEKKRYRDCINRSYYAAFYAVKAVLALEEKGFQST